MCKLLLLVTIISFVSGHSNKLTNDADLQTELMPQELNPFFVPAEVFRISLFQQSPLSVQLPLPLRMRRNTDVIVPDNSTMQQVKTYSRIVAGVVLVLSAIVEIVVYIIEAYA